MSYHDDAYESMKEAIRERVTRELEKHDQALSDLDAVSALSELADELDTIILERELPPQD